MTLIRYRKTRDTDAASLAATTRNNTSPHPFHKDFVYAKTSSVLPVLLE